MLAHSAAKVALKQGGKKRLALKGTKVSPKGALQARAGLAADAAIKKCLEMVLGKNVTVIWNLKEKCIAVREAKDKRILI